MSFSSLGLLLKAVCSLRDFCEKEHSGPTARAGQACQGVSASPVTDRQRVWTHPQPLQLLGGQGEAHSIPPSEIPIGVSKVTHRESAQSTYLVFSLSSSAHISPTLWKNQREEHSNKRDSFSAALGLNPGE